MSHYALVERAIAFMTTYQQDQPGLAELAKHLSVSESYIQRVFSEWVGVSPKQFLYFLTRESAKKSLRRQTTFSAAIDSGLSGSGRLHDLIVSFEGMTPGQYRELGAGLAISYGIAESPFGLCAMGQTARGICKLSFLDDETQLMNFIAELREEWPASHLIEDQSAVAGLVSQVFSNKSELRSKRGGSRLKLFVQGSVFQLKVWEALLKIPKGDIVSYSELANEVGMPNASRSVASAIARNKIGFLIPCHRVIRASGDFSAYRWGDSRKRIMIGHEICKSK